MIRFQIKHLEVGISNLIFYFRIRETTRFIRVRLGSVNYKEGGYLTGIKFFEIHPYFDDSKPLFDVALIKLPEPVRMTPSLNPIRLQKRYRDVIPTHFTVTAWPRRVSLAIKMEVIKNDLYILLRNLKS